MGLKRLFLLILLIPLTSQAVTVSRVTEFEPHTKLLAEDLNDEFDNIISAINGNLGPENFAGGAVASSSIVDGAVVTSKIADGAVTIEKLASVTPEVSSSASFSTDSTTYVNVPDLSTTITSTGRPIWVGLVWGDAIWTPEQGEVAVLASSFSAKGFLNFHISNSTRNVVIIGGAGHFDASSFAASYPCETAQFIDFQPAGTYTYQVRVKAYDDETIYVTNCKLRAFEL